MFSFTTGVRIACRYLHWINSNRNNDPNLNLHLSVSVYSIAKWMRYSFCTDRLLWPVRSAIPSNSWTSCLDSWNELLRHWRSGCFLRSLHFSKFHLWHQNYYVWLCLTMSPNGFSSTSKQMTSNATEWPFCVKYCFPSGIAESFSVYALVLRRDCFKIDGDAHIMSAARM